MQRLIVAVAIVALAGSTPALARKGSHGHSHGHHRHGGAKVANPSVPPSLTSDRRLTGAAPLPQHRQPRRGTAPAAYEKRDPQDIALDRKIKSICRGC